MNYFLRLEQGNQTKEGIVTGYSTNPRQSKGTKHRKLIIMIMSALEITTHPSHQTKKQLSKRTRQPQSNEQWLNTSVISRKF